MASTTVRFLLLVTAAMAAAVIFFLFAVVPPRSERLAAPQDSDLTRRTVPGAFHVHTTRSDGTADKTAVARAAASADLKFVIFTDHGDGTIPGDAAAYIDGVLCIDGVEISTDDGHYIAVDMATSPYPLGGAAFSVVEDVARLGGFGIAAHPDSPKRSLQWRDTTSRIDGIEWLSADSEWRDERRPRLARGIAEYLVRPAAALAALLDRPVATLARWNALTREHAVVAVAGHDAHGGIGGAVEDGRRPWLARVPSYAAAFRSMSTRVLVERPLTGDASADARLVLGALRAGRVFTAIDAIAGPGAIDFRVRTDGREMTMGESATFTADGVATVRAALPSGAQVVLLNGGDEIAAAAGGLEQRVSAPGAYRVEVHAPRAPGTPPVPWLVTNPVYLRAPGQAVPLVPPLPQVVTALDGPWHTEHDPASSATMTSTQGAMRVDYQLGSGERASQFVALAADLRSTNPAFDAVMFTGYASAPTRISVQLRFRSRGDQRWTRSVYLSDTPTPAVVRFSDMLLAGGGAPMRPDPRETTALLFVVDLTNAAPGRSGWFSIAQAALARVSP